MNPSPGMSDVLTQGIRIKAIAEYMPDYSNPAEDRYLYSYHITISNEGGG
jgi:ApaG protein